MSYYAMMPADDYFDAMPLRLCFRYARLTLLRAAAATRVAASYLMFAMATRSYAAGYAALVDNADAYATLPPRHTPPREPR